jgi:hypothetical protein
MGLFVAMGRAFGRGWLAALPLAAAVSASVPMALAAEIVVVDGPFASEPSTADAAVVPVFTIEPLSHGGSGRARITFVSRDAVGGAAVGAVCVRLCDGAFFPLEATGPAQCDGQDPQAPSEVFYRNGSDRIEDAVSADGRSYASLAHALRFRTVLDAACARHRAADAHSPLSDPTLRPGDAIMTPAGFVVFRGAEASAHGAGDFVGLAEAGLPGPERAELEAMERASLADGHPSLPQWLAALPPSAPASGVSLASRAARGDDRIRILVFRGAED